MFNVDWIRSITELLQHDARQPVWIGWIYSLIKPVRSIASDFAQLRDEIYEENRWNGTKPSLEKLLNDRYDPLLRRIEILDVEKDPVLYYQNGTEQPEAYYTSGAEQPVYYYRGAEQVNDLLLKDYEMKVRIHVSITFIPEEVLELIETYRYAGVRPKIFTYGFGPEDEEVETTFSYE